MRTLFKFVLIILPAIAFSQTPIGTPNKPINNVRLGPGGRLEANSGIFKVEPGATIQLQAGSVLDATLGSTLGITGSGGGSDASTTAKGIIKLSVAPVSSTNPIGVGDNDPRVGGTSDGLFGTKDNRGKPNDIYITIRPDHKPGSGTIEDPFDGTGDKMDAKLHSYWLAGTTNIKVHLDSGIGAFDCAPYIGVGDDGHRNWYPLDGWDIGGVGQYSTIIRFTASYSNPQVHAFTAIRMPYNEGHNYVKFHDLTLDINYPNLANLLADRVTPIRTFPTTAVGNSNGTITASGGALTVLDIGRRVLSTHIPANSWIGAMTDSQHFIVSSSPTSNVPVNVSAVTNGETITITTKDAATNALTLIGSHNIMEYLRVINGYGNLREMFVLIMTAPPGSDGIDNHMRRCLVEQCWGEYGNPFAMFGFGPGVSPSYPNAHSWLGESSVEDCTAIGRPGPIGYSIPGTVSPFTSGGVNMARVRNLTIARNTFIEMGGVGVAYIDTDDYDGLFVTGNTCINASSAVGLNTSGTNSSDWDTGDQNRGRNAFITNNVFGIQRRTIGGANYGIIVNGSQPATGIIISGNKFTYDDNGPGNDTAWTFAGNAIQDGRVEGNTFDAAFGAVHGHVGVNGIDDGDADPAVLVANNRDSLRNAPLGLGDNDKIMRVKATTTFNGSGYTPIVIPNTISTVLLTPTGGSLTGHIYLRSPNHARFVTYRVIDPKGVVNSSNNLIIQKDSGDSVINGTVPPFGDIPISSPMKETVVTSNLVNGINVYTNLQSSDPSTAGFNLFNQPNPSSVSYDQLGTSGTVTQVTPFQMGINPQYRTDFDNSTLPSLPTVGLTTGTIYSTLDATFVPKQILYYILTADYNFASVPTTPADFDASTNNRKWVLYDSVTADYSGSIGTWFGGHTYPSGSQFAIGSNVKLSEFGLKLFGAPLGRNLDTSASTSSPNTDVRVFRQTGVSAHTHNLPAITTVTSLVPSNQVLPGYERIIVNAGSDTLTVRLSGGGTTIATMLPGESALFVANSNNAWDILWLTRTSQKYRSTTGSGTITLALDPSRQKQNDIVNLTGNGTLAFTGLSNGMSGFIIVKQDVTGGRTLAMPASTKVQSNGMGAVSLSAGSNTVDILSWTYDGVTLYIGVADNFN